MGFAMQSRRPSAVAALLLMTAAPLSMALAQTTAGTELRFSIEERLTWDDNPDLDVAGSESEFYSSTQFDLNLRKASGPHLLTLDAGADWVIGRDDDRRNGFSNPDLRLNYEQDSTRGLLGFDVFFRERDVDALDFVTAGGSGGSVVSSVDGTGTQQRSGANLRYEFRQDAPFGGSFRLGYVDTEYSDTTDPSLTDTTRRTAGLDLRFDLSQVTTATFGFETADLEEVGAADQDIDTYRLGLNRDLANGSAGVSLSYAEINDDDRTSLLLTRSMDLTNGQLDLNIGAADPISGSTSVIGGLSWQHDLPNGGLTLALDRNITSDEDEDETELTTLSLSLQHALSARWDSNIFLGLRDSTETGSGTSTETANIAINFDYALTKDWDMRFGASHRRRDESGSGNATGNSVYVALRRNFDLNR